MSGTSSLAARTYFRFAIFAAVLWLLIFAPSGDLRYREGWVFWLGFSLLNLAFLAVALRTSSDLVERRSKAGPRAERRRTQKLAMGVMRIAFFGMIVFAGLDHRFALSRLHRAVVFFGDALAAAGLMAIFWVLRENSFASAVVETFPEHKVIDSGPYRLVRHPMYAGGLIFLAGIPLALGSAWALLFFIPLFVAIVVRLRDEERFLAEALPGYADYCARTKYRLIPGIF